jgi:hypothetical protein
VSVSDLYTTYVVVSKLMYIFLCVNPRKLLNKKQRQLFKNDIISTWSYIVIFDCSRAIFWAICDLKTSWFVSCLAMQDGLRMHACHPLLSGESWVICKISVVQINLLVSETILQHHLYNKMLTVYQVNDELFSHLICRKTKCINIK